jgi:putative ubiquitin-RnfH superfamily antitoxin RatB of RatAB toxin-antitoxin module
LQPGDRVEIYRVLQIAPKQARQRWARRRKQESGDI